MPVVSTQTEKDLAALLLKLSGNPKTRLHTLRMIKAVDPNYRIPADVQLEEYKAQVAREKENDKITAQAEKSRERQTAQRAKLLDKYTEDQIKEIEAGMSKVGLGDYEAGAKLYAADMTPAKASNNNRPRHGQIWEFPDLPGLLQNPEKAATDAAYAVLDEMRAGR